MEGPLQALTYAAVHEGCEHRGILVSAGMAGGQGGGGGAWNQPSVSTEDN